MILLKWTLELQMQGKIPSRREAMTSSRAVEKEPRCRKMRQMLSRLAGSSNHDIQIFRVVDPQSSNPSAWTITSCFTLRETVKRM
jgi:hypothetical protein